MVAFNYAASSAIIEKLFDALSHVRWPIYGINEHKSDGMMQYAMQISIPYAQC